MGAEGQRQEMEIYGTRGRLRFVASFRGTTLVGTKQGEPRWETIAVDGITLPDEEREVCEDYFRPGRLDETNNVYRWLEAIHKGRRNIAPSLEDGWRTQQVIDAVLQASAERRWVNTAGNDA